MTGTSVSPSSPHAFKGPGVHFPPPLLYAAGFVAGLGLERWGVRIHLSSGALRAAFVFGGWAAIVAGLAFSAAGIWTFLRARTSPLPMRPARVLVQSGPYRVSRNPMYVGLAAAYVGLASLANVAWPVVFLPLVLVCLRQFVIAPEERYLAAAFGEDYAAYCRRVRRWL